MKRIVLITVLAVLLMAAAGTTTAAAEGPAKTALSCESPTMPPPVVGEAFQINGTLTYGTSSTPVPHRLITVYTSTDEKKWTEVGSVNTDDDGQYTVTTSQDTPGTYYYKAVFDGDKIFKKVTSPTRSVTVNQLLGLTPMAFVSYFEFHNYGWFVTDWRVIIAPTTVSHGRSPVIHQGYGMVTTCTCLSTLLACRIVHW